MSVNIELVYQGHKDTLCGSLQSEVEAKLFTYKLTVADTFEAFKNGHKYSPETGRKLTLEKSNQHAIVFGLNAFIEYYGEMRRQAAAYLHKTHDDDDNEEGKKENGRI